MTVERPTFVHQDVAGGWAELERDAVHLLRSEASRGPEGFWLGERPDYLVSTARLFPWIDRHWGPCDGELYMVSRVVQRDRGWTVKVGFSRNPRERLKALQTGCPDELTIRECYPAPRRIERAAHELFAKDRRAGEWFEASWGVHRLFDALSYIHRRTR